MSDNFISMTGNVTRDPELRFTPNGQATVNFGIAVNRRWQNRQTGEWEEAVTFIDVVAWGDLAQNVAQSIHKGNRVQAVGRLDFRTWEKDGEKKSKHELVADDVLPSLKWATASVVRTVREGGGQGNGGGAEGAAAPAPAASGNGSAPASAPSPAPAPAAAAPSNVGEEF